MGHTVDLQLPIPYIHKYYYDKVLTYYMGSEAQTTYRLPSPLAGLLQHPIRLWGDVGFQLRGQDGGEPLDGGVSIIHDGRRSVRAGVVGNHVPR